MSKWMDSFSTFGILSLILLATTKADNEELCQNEKVIVNITTLGQKVPVHSSPPCNQQDRCCISVKVESSVSHGVHIEQLVTKCYIPYRILNGIDEQILLYQYVTCKPKNGAKVYSVDVLFKHIPSNGSKILLHVGENVGVNFTVSAYPLQAMKQPLFPINLATTPTAYITSHQEFPLSPYSNNLFNSLLLQAIPNGYDVVIEFIQIELGNSMECQRGNAGDMFNVYQVDSTVSLYECADIRETPVLFVADLHPYDYTPLPSVVINATDHLTSVRLGFITRSTNLYRGFLLLVTALQSKAVAPFQPNATTALETETEPVSSTGTPPESQKESITQSDWATDFFNDTRTPATNESKSTIARSSASHLYGAAGGAGGGLILLMIVIVVLACVLYRRSKNRKESPSIGEADHRNSRRFTNVANPSTSMDAVMPDMRATDKTNKYSTNVYFELEPPGLTDIQLKTDPGISRSSPHEDSSRVRSEPDDMESNALYAPIVKERIEMVENSLYGSA